MDEPIARRTAGPGAESLSVAVVEAIAERAAVAPMELDRPLYDAIDPDALEHLFPQDGDGRPRSEGYVTFSYADFRVRVSSDREVRVFGQDGADEGS